MKSVSRRRFLQAGMGAAAGMALSGQNADTAGKRPNILFCISDDQSYPHASAYGCPWVKTPAFDRVAREGILFTHNYTPNAKCAPSRACILTGRNSWQLEEACNHIPFFPDKFRTYPEALSDAGYHTGYTGKGWAPGKVGTVDGKPRQLTGKNYSKLKSKPPARAISSNDYAANFEAFLDDNANGEPFCFWYGAIEPHRAYEYGAGIRKGGKSVGEIDRVLSFWPDNETVRTDMLDYAFEIEHFDNHLQRMIGLLEERGELDNTIIVATSDNGMPFPRIKGQEYEHSNHLPLAIMWKGGIKNPGRVVEDYVSFIDLAPTFLDIAGVSERRGDMEAITGRSLMNIFKSSKEGVVDSKRDHVLIGKERHDIGRPNNWGYPTRGIVKNGYLYLENYEIDRWPAGHPYTGYMNTDGSPTKSEVLKTRYDSQPDKYWQWGFGKRGAVELYDIRIDMDCVNNLADNPSYQSLKQALQEQMVKELKEQGDPRMFGNGAIFDQYEYADDQWNDFFDKKKQGDKRVPGWINASDFDVE